MKLLKKGCIVQFVGVLALLFGNFYTVGAAVADVVATDEIATKNAKLIDDKRQLVTTAKVGDKSKLTFDVTVGSLSSAGKVKFEYDRDMLTIKKRQYQFKNGSAKVVVDIDGKNSTIQWHHAINMTDLEVALPVKFNRPANRYELAVMVDEKKVELPTLTVVNKNAQKAKGITTATNESIDGNLRDDNLVNQVLVEAEKDEAASDQAEAAKEVEEAKKQEIPDENAVKKEDDSQESKFDQQPVSGGPSNEAKIDENSSQADEIEETKQSDSDKAKEFVKEKREADQKMAEEKSQKAVENLKKAAEKDAQNPQCNNQSSSIQKSSGNNKESRSPRDPSLANVDIAERALAETDDGDDEAHHSQSQLPTMKAFETKRDLKDLVNTKFFNSITVKYNNEEIKIPTEINNEVNASIPSSIKDSNTVSIDWTWDTTTIGQSQTGDNFTILDGDYYEFTLKGFELNYVGNPSLGGDILGTGDVKVGEYSISPVVAGNTSQHKVRITFFPGNLSSETTIKYSLHLDTTFSKGSTDVSFGEIAKDGAKIEVADGAVTISKHGEFDGTTGGSTIDYDTIAWTSTLTVNRTGGADQVNLRDTFGSHYQINDDAVGKPASYTFEVFDDKSKQHIFNKGSAGYSKIMNAGSWLQQKLFKFIASDLLPTGRTIKKIVVTMRAPVTSIQPEYHNKIVAQNVKFGTETLKEVETQHILKRESNALYKSATTVRGDVQYTIRFNVKNDQDNLTLTDELKTKKFKYQELTEGNYRLTRDGDNTNYWDNYVDSSQIVDSPDGSKLTVKFKSDIKANPGVYKLIYKVVPVGEVSPTDYHGLTNQVNWGGKESFTHVYKSATNQKGTYYVSEDKPHGNDWTNYTTDWAINVNRIDQQIDGDITITEPDTEKQNETDYDYAKYYNLLIDNFGNLSDYIKFYAKFVHEKHEIKYERYNGQFYWIVNDAREEKPAFSIGSSEDGKGNVIGFKLVVHRMPKQNNNNRVSQEFGVQLAGVPIDKAKLAKNTSGYLYNHATVEYNEGKEHISGSSKIPTEVANNLSKSGKLSTDFHSNPDNRKIDWTVAFNQRGWLAAEENIDKLLKEGGIAFTDTVGADKAWGKDEKASTSLLLQY